MPRSTFAPVWLLAAGPSVRAISSQYFSYSRFVWRARISSGVCPVRSRSRIETRSKKMSCAASYRLPIGSRLVLVSRSSAIVCAGRWMVTSERRAASPPGCAVMTSVRAPASWATPSNAEGGREGAGAGADHQQVAGADRRSGHVADDVGVEPEVHEAHAEGTHHQPFATDAVAGDAAGAVESHRTGGSRRRWWRE